MNEHTAVLVIGAGQSGLAMSRELSARGIEHQVLERHDAPGDVWRERWDSLRLFTPAPFSSLPGMPFPGASRYRPTASEFANYLDDYAKRIKAPLNLGETATHMSVEQDGTFIVDTSTKTGHRQWQAKRVVIATGDNNVPTVPPVARDLDARITQLHTSRYRRPADLPERRVLVVGSGASGVQLGIELAQAGREVTVAGRPPLRIPALLLKVAGGPWFAFLNRVVTLATPIGRRVASKTAGHGLPLIGISASDLDQYQVRRTPRLAGGVNGVPRFEDGSVAEVDAVLWATGYRPDFSWIDGLPLNAHGIPSHTRGVSSSLPGLSFMGLPFQFGLTSALIGGVGRDAAYLADRIALEEAEVRA